MSCTTDALTVDRRRSDGAGDAPPSSDGPLAWTRGEVVALVGLVLGFAIAAAWTLGRQSLTGDEAATWAISGHSASDLVHVLASSGGDRAAGLYYVALYGWVRVLGTGAVALRSLSVLAGVATLSVFYVLARRLGRGVAFVAGLVLAASPFYLLYARQARAYSLAVLLVVLTAWALVRALETDDAARWTVFVVVATLALYTQWFTALVIVAFYGAALATSRSALSRRAVAATAALLVLASPIAVLVATGDTGGVGWIAPLSVAQLRDLAVSLTGTHSRLAWVVFFGVAAVGLIVGVGRSRSRASAGSSTVAAIAAAWFVVPTGLLVVVSIGKPLLVSRYLLVTLPGLALLVGLGVAAVARHRVALMVVGVALLSALGGSAYGPLWAARHMDEDWSGIVQTVAAHAAPGQAVLVYPANAVYAFGYYARAAAPLDRRRGPTWPPVAWEAAYGRDVPRATSVLRTAATVRATTVWLVIRDPVGPTISATTSNPVTLRALEQILGRRFPHRDVVTRFAHRTASVVRYTASGG
ncbi:MAG TPA: glycosyltransferase family 39 protein [Acidimicrobiia bacterium]|nr:glycosyltransferase family 39 protein [Acidimicrobiia bacterium]